MTVNTVGAVVGALLAVALVACSSDSAAPESVEGARLSIESDANVSTTIETFEELQAALPFKFVEPEVPDGASFTWLAVRLPPARVDEEARERIIALDMFVASADGTGLLHLQASRMGTMPGGGETTTVAVGSTEGELFDDGNSAALGWRSCDVGYLLTYDADLLPTEDALAIAASIDDSCG